MELDGHFHAVSGETENTDSEGKNNEADAQ